MELIKELLHYFLHLDDALKGIVFEYKSWTYLILFLIIFVETGVVIMPFLPGDSLLFVAGSLAALNGADNLPLLNIYYLLGLLFIAAFSGDTVNYLLGSFLGPKVFKKDYALIKRKHIEKTQLFFEKHGPKTIIMARFIPIVRTFAPFVAGIGKMNYAKFISYNIIGGLIWVISLTLAGYFFGQIPIVANNFEKVVIGIVLLSITPPAIEYLKSVLSKKKTV